LSLMSPNGQETKTSRSKCKIGRHEEQAVTGWVNQELLLQNEYLAAENRILRARLPSRLRPGDPERATLHLDSRRVRVASIHETSGSNLDGADRAQCDS
jgi:hypothetical protein